MRGHKYVCECERDERFVMWDYFEMGINYNNLNRNGIVTFGSASEPLRRDRISAITSRQKIQQHPRQSNKTIFIFLNLNTFRLELFALHSGYVKSSVLRGGPWKRNVETSR